MRPARARPDGPGTAPASPYPHHGIYPNKVQEDCGDVLKDMCIRVICTPFDIGEVLAAVRMAEQRLGT